MLQWLAAGGWASAGLTAAVLGWLWEHAKRERDRARADAEVLRGQVIRLTGQLGSMAATAGENQRRLEGEIDALQRSVEAAHREAEELARAYPGMARRYLAGVLQAASAGGSAQQPPVSTDTPAAVPGDGKRPR